MSKVLSVIEYDEGFAIIKDDKGSYLAFKDSDMIEDLESEDPLNDFPMALPSRKGQPYLAEEFIY